MRRAVELEPNQPVYGNNLALVVGEQGRDQESLDLFRRYGTEEHACANMAYLYAQRGEYPKAMEMYSRVLTQDPKDRTAAAALLQVSKLQDQRQRAERQVARRSPPPQAVANPAGPSPAAPAADEAIARAASDLAPAAAACTQVSAEVDSAGEETSSASDVRWPEGALDVDRFAGVVQ